VRLVRAVLRPVGYLMFVVAVVALSGTATVFGDEHELGFFSARLASMLARYPEVTGPGPSGVAHLGGTVRSGAEPDRTRSLVRGKRLCSRRSRRPRCGAASPGSESGIEVLEHLLEADETRIELAHGDREQVLGKVPRW
jgi:hypothetical protein